MTGPRPGTVISGLGVSPGRAAGPVVLMPEPVPEPPAGSPLPAGTDAAAEADRVQVAARRVRDDLQERAATAHGESKSVLEATALMAADPALLATAQDKVIRGLSAVRAVWEAAGEVAEKLAAVGGYLADRVHDIAGVRDHIIAELSGLPSPGAPVQSRPYVLVARDVAPADMAILETSACVALVTADGSPTSHTAILARAFGVPAVVAAPAVLGLSPGTVVLVDGSAGTVRVDPPVKEVTAAFQVSKRPNVFDGTGRTADGRRVELLANIADIAGVKPAVDAKAEGVGLFRTESCFLGHTTPPSIEEQVSVYRKVLGAFTGRKVVVRTLDAGADKPLQFLRFPAEANPALGVRGVRTSARRPDLLTDQLTAIAAAAGAESADVWVMAPMVATAAEAAEFVAACARAGLPTAGVMVEVPAAALMAPAILEHARFASVGTNDLAQYTMAADRLQGELAYLNDLWQPAVLQLVQLTCRAGVELNRPVGVCGEAAADPALACVLVGLGASSLSMTPRSISDVAAVLAATPYEQCVRLAALALTAPDASAARQRVRAALPVLGELGM